MLPKISLLSELRSGGYEASLITTFNAYLPFYEEVVLRHLASAGIRHNVLLMDARQYVHSVATHPPKWAGRRYTLVPMSVPGAFHPKLMFLAGKNKGLLAIGSHNMTLAGFGLNRELTNVVKIGGSEDEAGVALANQVWEAVSSWVRLFAGTVPPRVLEMVHQVTEFAPWMKHHGQPDPDIEILAGQPGGITLWEQLVRAIGGPIDQVSIAGAFFDSKLTFLDRLRQDLTPKRLTVGIDPMTVQLPSNARARAAFEFVEASTFGLETDEPGRSRRYLHAKGMYVRQEDGEAVLVCGSANPSRPAWLSRQGDGNVELMLLRRGADAKKVSAELGFLDLETMPLLDETAWKTIENGSAYDGGYGISDVRTSVAIVDASCVLIQRALLEGLREPSFVLVDHSGEELARQTKIEIGEILAAVSFPPEQVALATQLYCFIGNEVRLRLLLHHARLVEDQARTGVQRRFKEALLSLNTDTPNIGLLIECIDKIIFSGETSAVRRKLTEADQSRTPVGDPVIEYQSLAIDVADMKKRVSKLRLRHASDLGYLLDALIYHLRVQDDVSLEELDQFGRSEEEQVGEDDEDVLSAPSPGEPQIDLLKLCHAKVRRVVSRMVKHLEAASSGSEPLGQALVRLLGVLAVLRELRSCDARVPWVGKGQTTVPRDIRMHLLEMTLCHLFEGPVSLLHLETLGEEFRDSDDVARLKGLILWLAWDVGLTMDMKQPFMESLEQQHQRLRENAMVLALAQMIRSDEIVIDEAKVSIGSVTSGELDWLDHVRYLADQCDAIRTGGCKLIPAEKARPGDIAMHTTLSEWDLRVVESSGGGHVNLVSLGPVTHYRTFTPRYLKVARLHLKGGFPLD